MRTHEAILDSAARIVRDRGIAGTRVADVMAGARLTVGGFYAHFGSKAALVDETLKEMGAKLRTAVFADLDEKPEADRVAVLLQRYLSPTHRDLKTDGCPLPAVVGEVATTAPEHRAALAAEVEALAAGIAGALRGMGPSPRRQTALALLSLMFGGLCLSRALRGAEVSDEVLKACRAVGSRIVTIKEEKP